jgi:hypothetical protein
MAELMAARDGERARTAAALEDMAMTKGFEAREV